MRRKNKVFCKYETKRTLTENKEEGNSLKTGECLYIKHVSSANSSVVGHPGEKFYYIASNLGRYWYSLYMLFLSLAVHPRNSASHLVRFLFITPAMCGCFDNSTALARKRPGVTNAVTILLSILDIFSAITIKKFYIFVKILDLFASNAVQDEVPTDWGTDDGSAHLRRLVHVQLLVWEITEFVNREDNYFRRAYVLAEKDDCLNCSLSHLIISCKTASINNHFVSNRL